MMLRTKEFEMDAGNLKMRPFFTDLKRDRGIGLENLVYYRDETHYLVMTADRKSLLAKGVLRENHSSTSELLKSENINQCNLVWTMTLPLLCTMNDFVR